MRDGLVSRVTRLVSGSINSLVEAVENTAPETVMKEAIRELESAIDEVRGELGVIIASKHHASKRLAETTAKHEELFEKINLAVGQERDDLAKAAISKQLDLEAQIPVLENAVQEIGQKVTELEGYVSALQGRKREMEGDLETFRKSKSDIDTAGVNPGNSSSSVEQKAGKAETAFNRAMTAATGLEVTVATDSDTTAKLEELEEIARDNRIAERLAATKAGNTNKGGE